MHQHHVLGLLEHLALRDPQGGLGDGDGKIVDLDAVELVDAHLDGRNALVRKKGR